jgi:CRP-like cAMP-binding protein
MSVRIKIAETAEERDALFRARHRVYVEQGKYMPPRPDARILDRFDTFPTTTNLIVLDGSDVVGGVRLTEQGPAGLPADGYFDFASHLPEARGRVGCASMLCLDWAYRHQKRLIPSLGGMLYALAMQRGITHLVAACNPEIEEPMRASGYRRVAPVFRHPSGLDVVPLVLDVNQLGDRMAEFLRRHRQHLEWTSWERAFFSAGETVIHAGAPGEAAYVVLDGVAFAEMRTARGRWHCTRLDAGDLFGELALLTGRPNPSRVMAAVDLDVLVLDAESFRAQLRSSPEQALNLLEVLGSRLLDALGARPLPQVSRAGFRRRELTMEG